jgi:Zn-dependent peptidase ImmA (M78 family)
LRRGFKALAERNALAARTVLGLVSTAALDPWAYASHLSVVVLDWDSLDMTADSKAQLVIRDPESWSAMTLVCDGIHAIVVNPAHAMTRQRADLVHELAHIEHKHVPARVEVSTTGVLLLSDYSDDQEQEADWQAGAHLLPRDALVQMRAQNATKEQIAAFYGISPQLCEWRLRMTGVDVQMRRARSR